MTTIPWNTWDKAQRQAAPAWWDEAQARVTAAAAAPPPPPSWWDEAQARVEAAARTPSTVTALAAPGGIEPTAALAAQLGVGVGAALVLLSPRWRRRIPPALLLIASAAIIAYIQTKARPAALTLTVTPPPARVEVPTAPPTGPVSGLYDQFGRFIFDNTGL